MMLPRTTASTRGHQAGELAGTSRSSHLTGLSRTGIIVSTAPGLLALGLFYSLALHMHRALHGWPAGIGEAGFPPALAAHAFAATNFFWVTLVVSFFSLPGAILVSGLMARWRHLVPYLVLHALAFVVSIALMQFAPEPFLYWWRD